MLAALESGWVADEIHRAAWEWQRQVESGERVIVGVNRFADDEPATAPPFRPDPEVERARAERLAAWRAQRDAVAVDESLARLETTARGSDNLVPPILEALRRRATLGEVCDTLRGVFGTHRPGGS